MARYTVEPSAEDDLRGIWGFIARHNPRAADNVVDAAYDAFQILADNPRMAPLQDYSDEVFEDVRNWHIPDYSRYVIFYRPTEDGIQVIHVYHDARDIEALFASK